MEIVLETVKGTNIAFQPMRIGEILDKSFGILFNVLTTNFLFAYLGVAIINSVIHIITYNTSEVTEANANRALIFSGSSMLVSIFIWILLSAIQVNLISAVAAQWSEYFGIRSSRINVNFSLVMSFISLQITISIVAFLYFLLLVFPGVIYFVNRVLAPYIYLLEQSSKTDSLEKSKQMMTSHPGVPWYSFKTPLMRISGLLLVTTIISFIPGTILAVGFFLVKGSTSVTFVQFFANVIAFFVQYICEAFSIIALCGFYYDLRMRNEGIDLTARLAQLNEP